MVGTDFEVKWFGGVEYLNCPFFIVGKCVTGWYPPRHGGKWWPDRNDIANEPPDNWWKLSATVNDVPLRDEVSLGSISYCYNDAGTFPWCPADLDWDYAGVSGGGNSFLDPQEPVEYGAVENVDVSVQSRVTIDCTANCALAVSVIWHTAVMITSDTTIHGEVVYLR